MVILILEISMMELNGKLLIIFDKEQGYNEKGTWERQAILFETLGNYPRKVLIQFWKSKIDFSRYTQGDVVKVKINIESHEYEGKWYTQAWGWFIEKIENLDITKDTSLKDNWERQEEDLPFI